jgi:hypothetical protein
VKKRIETALFLVALALQWDLGATINGDGYYRYRNLVALLSRGDVLPQDPAGAGYSLILPLLASPLYVLGNPDLLVPYFNLILFTIAAALAWFALDEQYSRRFLILLLLGTMFSHHLQTFSAEVSAALLCAIGLWGVAHEKKWGWFPVVIGAVSTPALLVPLTLVTGIEAAKSRQLRKLWPIALGAALYLIESRLRRGSFTSTYYFHDHPAISERGGFSNPLLSGIVDILFSPGKGLIFYLPALFLAAKQEQKWHRLMLLFVAGMVLVYAKWWDWSGDWFWGPRFFLFASIPAALALATRRYTLVTLLITLLSLWVGLDGAIFGNLDMGICVADGGTRARLCQNTIQYSALWRPFIVRPALDLHQWIRIAFWCASAVLLYLTGKDEAYL